MNINEMSEQEKSLAIISLMPDWRVSPHWAGDMYLRTGDGYEIALLDPHYLYEQRVMWVAWRVLNWAANNMPDQFDDWGASNMFFLANCTAEIAVATWLDAVLQMAVEAGRVEVCE